MSDRFMELLAEANLTGRDKLELVVYAKAYSAAERRRGAKEGWARPDGSFPIRDRGDVSSAVKLAKSDADRAWVKKRAKAIGASDMIPDSWK